MITCVTIVLLASLATSPDHHRRDAGCTTCARSNTQLGWIVLRGDRLSCMLQLSRFSNVQTSLRPSSSHPRYLAYDPSTVSPQPLYCGKGAEPGQRLLRTGRHPAPRRES